VVDNANKGINILATGRALPENIVTNDDLSKIVDTNDEWIQTRTGIKQRYKCEEESSVTLAVEAAKKAVEKAKNADETFDINEIGTIVVATTTPEYAFPTISCMVQKALGLSHEVMSFDISAACAGFLYGLNICRGLLVNSRKRYALMIGSEELSRIINYEDRGSCILFGDGAGAAIVELSDKLYYQRCYSDGDQKALWCYGVGNDNCKINMSGNKVFRFAVNVLENSLNQVLNDAGLTMDDVDYVICHQANKRIIEHVQKKYPEHMDKFYINIDRYGNTSAASIPIAIDEMFEQGILKKGMKVASIGFGAGFTWSGLLFEV